MTKVAVMLNSDHTQERQTPLANRTADTEIEAQSTPNNARTTKRDFGHRQP
ncbi:hypothetical protein VPMS16_3623 [Vibrio sp. 16]|nr:hypothetical protein VPMS16_3623 [Vibrio sp. 16]